MSRISIGPRGGSLVAALALCAATATVLPAASASAGQAPPPKPATGHQIVAGVAVPRPCSTLRRSWYTRTEACMANRSMGAFYVLRRGRIAGVVYFNTLQRIRLKVNSRTFTETFSLQPTLLVQAGAVGVKLASLRVACGGTCTARVGFPRGRTLIPGKVIRGTITYHDSTRTVNRTAIRYQPRYVKRGHTFAMDDAWDSEKIRCDNVLRGRQGAGCVFPAVAPSLTTMRRLPHIAQNIRRIQNRGTHQFGKRDADGYGWPLHRITDEHQIDRNREVLCPRSRPRPPGMSCDEYPFATTKEGGNGARPADRGWAWVPFRENNRQGGLLNSFYLANRVLDGDGYWVDV